MIGRNLAIVLGVLVFVIVSYFLLSNKANNSYFPLGAKLSISPSPSQITQAKNFSIVMSQLSNSGEVGIATIEEENNKKVVRLKLLGFPKDAAQPAHIHIGTCLKPGEIKFPLNDVLNGESETSLNASIEAISKNHPLIINVHKSLDEPDIYYSCGDIVLK